MTPFASCSGFMPPAGVTRAMTSARGPKLATAPSFSTSILSTLRRSEGRCAMITTVTPSALRISSVRDQRLLAFVVEVGIRLVEHHQPRLAVERARERDALPLAGRKRLAGFADLGVVALGQAQDELVHVRALRGAHHFGGVRLAEARDVLRHRAAEELDVLRQVAEVRPQTLARPRRHVGAIEAHHAGSRLPYADDQARERRLARRARPDQAERLARRELEGNAAQDRLCRPA